jgi:hypothetical protein
LWSWIAFEESIAEEKFYKLMQSKHVKMLEDPDPNECGKHYDSDDYSLRLDTAGVIFYTDFGYTGFVCDEELLFTFQELLPFLSEEGKRCIGLISSQRKTSKKTGPVQNGRK